MVKFMIREVGTEKYVCEINNTITINIDLNEEEYKPTKYMYIGKAQDVINSLSKDKKYQIVVV